MNVEMDCLKKGSFNLESHKAALAQAINESFKLIADNVLNDFFRVFPSLTICSSKGV